MYLYNLALKRSAIWLTLCVDLSCFKILMDKLLAAN